ncbi:MAG: CDGSH iron-sulfur domain-containing protein [Thermoplasmata archaeon]
MPDPKPTITIRPDGPYRVEGDVPLEDAGGKQYDPKPAYSLCRCGGSKNKPYPQKTLALIAVDGALQNLYSGLLDPMIAQLRGPDYREVASKFIASMFTNPGTEAVREKTLAATAATPQHVLIGSFESMKDPEVWKDDPIRVPLLVVNAKSPYWTPAYVEFVRKIAPQVDYRVIEGPGHFLMLEKPREFNAAVLEFLQKNNLLRG